MFWNAFSQDKRQKSDDEMRGVHISPFRKPLKQLINPPACMDGNKHVSNVMYYQI